MINKYGYFIYEDFPVSQNASITVNYSVQTKSGDIGNAESEATDYATFEGDGIDFSKPLYFASAEQVTENYQLLPNAYLKIDYKGLTNPTVSCYINGQWKSAQSSYPYVLVRQNDKRGMTLKSRVNTVVQVKLEATGDTQDIVNASAALSDVDGEFATTHSLTITPSDAISGSGITLKTLNADYDLEITVTDEDGTRVEQFSKTDDEFYAFSYSGLQSLEIEFTSIEPYSFIKLVGFQFGKVRMLGERELKDFPKIENHFSLIGDVLEYDTLDLSVLPNGEYVFLEGQKIKYSRTGQVFYINSVNENSDGSFELTCYDDISRLEGLFTGVMAYSNNINDWLPLMMKGGNDDISLLSWGAIAPILTFTGYIGLTTYREALRLLMLGIGGRLRRYADSTFRIIDVYTISTKSSFFNESNIVSVPEVIKNDRYGKASLLKHYYKKKAEEEECFNGHIDTTGQQLITWNEPHINRTYKYVTGQDQDGNDQYADVNPSYFNIVKQGVNHAVVENQYTQRISVWGYPYNESHYRIDKENTSVPVQFKNNVFNVSEATALIDADNSQLLNYILELSKYYIIVRFESIQEANAGEHVEVTYFGKSYTGWITRKIDEAKGLYQYEVLCK